MCNRLDTIPVCDGRTDILPRHSPHYTYASSDKNCHSCRYRTCRIDRQWYWDHAISLSRWQHNARGVGRGMTHIAPHVTPPKRSYVIDAVCLSVCLSVILWAGQLTNALRMSTECVQDTLELINLEGNLD